MDDWRIALLEARRNAGVGRKKLAELAGVSVETIRGYEIGRRHPRHESLESILTALALPRAEANVIREGAGFAPARPAFGGAPGYYYGIEELAAQAERAQWPEFITNDGFELVVANRSLCALWGIRSLEKARARRGATGMSIFGVLDAHDLVRCVSNWDEMVEVTAGFIKGRPAAPPGEAEQVLYRALFGEPFASRDARFHRRLKSAWERAKPIPPKIRWEYQVIWDAPGAGKMHFHGIVSPANEREGLVFNDWIPVDAESWRRLQTKTKT